MTEWESGHESNPQGIHMQMKVSVALVKRGKKWYANISLIYLSGPFILSEIHVPTLVTDLCSLHILPHLTGQADIPNLLINRGHLEHCVFLTC